MANIEFYSKIEDNLRNNHSQHIIEGINGTKHDFNQLLEMVNKKYETIQSQNLRNNVIVYMTSTSECLATILAIWKSNRTYVPINISTPNKRVEYIKNSLGNYSEVKINELGNLEIISHKGKPVTSKINNIAYIIFTSGTTGNPKGVKISYDNLEYLFRALGKKFNFKKATDTWINLHSLEFDFSIWEIFGSLYYCHNLVLLGKNIKIYEFDKIAQLISNEQVTILNQTPSAFFTLINYLKISELDHLNTIIFGGEKLDYSELAKVYTEYHKEKNIEFYNLYGITEITIHATFHKIIDEDFKTTSTISNIGRGIFDDNVYLEKTTYSDKLEIVVKGATVSEGYINNNSETNKKFKNIFNNRLYFSGDIGEYLPNGEINYIGRADNQIELNGYRIELDDIKQNIFNTTNSIKNIFIIKHNNKLAVFYILDKDKRLDLDLLKTKLQNTLPSYMIPSYYIPITKIPLTTNGKVDTDRLQRLLNKKIEDNTPQKRNNLTEFEEWLIKSYKLDVNNFEQINFTEIGLTSMELISLHEKISSTFKLKKEISIVDFFQFSSIKAFELEFLE